MDLKPRDRWLWCGVQVGSCHASDQIEPLKSFGGPVVLFDTPFLPRAMTDWIQPPAPVRLSGDEPIGSTGFTVRDFWSWLSSDLRTNTTRSLLAEFIVAIAVGAERTTRIEWDSYDVRSPAGTRIEVKAAAYRQAWAQRKPSPIRFTRLRARTWTPQSAFASEQTYNAQVYVFALHTALDHESYDALNINQWVFWVLSAAAIAAEGTSSISMSTLDRITERVTFADLNAAIQIAAESSAT